MCQAIFFPINGILRKFMVKTVKNKEYIGETAQSVVCYTER